MEIIKEAFFEGRETETDWDKSTAKENSLKFEIALENFSSMTEKERLAPIPLQQICPTSGKVLNTFSSRLAAAKYIVHEILKNPNKKPIPIAGNMEICMRAGWKCYGYYWKIFNGNSSEKNKIANAKKVFLTYNGKDMVFDSIADCARFVDMSPKSLAHKLKNNKITFTKNKNLVGRYSFTMQLYNPKSSTLVFKTIKEAGQVLGVCDATIRKRYLNKNKKFNNYKIEIK